MVILLGFVGLFVGSAINVVVARLSPHRDSCPGCRDGLRFAVPLVGHIRICGGCARVRRARLVAVQSVTGIAFAVTASRLGWSVLLPTALWFVAACIALTLTDIDDRRLPNVLTVPTYGVVLTGLLAASLAQRDWGPFTRAVAGGVILAGMYAALAVAFPRGMGWGDVKWAAVIGTVCASASWGTLLVGGLGAFLLGGFWGAAGVMAGRVTRASPLPFGPFMVAAAVAALAVGPQVADACADWVV